MLRSVNLENGIMFSNYPQKNPLSGESFPEIILQMSFIRLKSGVFNEVHSVR